MTKLNLARVLELDREATKGEWAVAPSNEHRPENTVIYCVDGGCGGPCPQPPEWDALVHLPGTVEGRATADLIAYYRTAAPEMARWIGRARRYLRHVPGCPKAGQIAGNRQPACDAECGLDALLAEIKT